MVSSYKRSTSSRYADMLDQYTPCFFCGCLFSRVDSTRRHANNVTNVLVGLYPQMSNVVGVLRHAIDVRCPSWHATLMSHARPV
ncbi:hypothetical protein FOXYSP1_16465 [Fusarium oxysporum f. sp. phaseoli]